MSCVFCSPVINCSPLIVLQHDMTKAIAHLENAFKPERNIQPYTLKPDLIIEERELVLSPKTNRPWYKQGMGKYE